VGLSGVVTTGVSAMIDLAADALLLVSQEVPIGGALTEGDGSGDVAM
jgi:hypothetical protein